MDELSPSPPGQASLPVEVNLTAAIVAVSDGEPVILTTHSRDGARLPSGPFNPLVHRTFEMGLRAWVLEQTGIPLGYVEQLYTFGDRGRHAQMGDQEPHVVSVGYLALTRIADNELLATNVQFRRCYGFLPWEDWRKAKPALIDQAIIPALTKWAAREPALLNSRGLSRADRLDMLFSEVHTPFDYENVLERYEMLYEAGLVEEAKRDGRASPLLSDIPQLGPAMIHDHRRIVATALGRLRAKMKYRPVIFELMPESFTLTALQHMAEAIAGHHLHKQNFRRFLENAAVVETTGETERSTGGRPAALFRFRKEVIQERPATGLRVGSRG